MALQILERTPLRSGNDYLEILLAVVIGLVITVAIYRSKGFQSLLRFGIAIPFLALGLFLFTSPAGQLVFRSGALNEPAGITVGEPAPIVFVIFDEFPVASLIDGDGDLQAEAFPNFARLAADSTWYRNAITVQQQTEESVPAILTGNDPPPDRIPMAFDYPANLFTMLSESYEIRAREQVTELCPEYACENRSRPSLPFGERWNVLLSDLAIVSGHVLLPTDLRQGLPPIDHSWANFGAGLSEEDEDFNIITRFNETVDADRRIPFQEFLETIQPPDGEPTLDFIHMMLPHIPWSYSVTGQRFYSPSPSPGSARTGWGPDEWLVNQNQQRHLIQVQYVDSLVGQMIDRLEELGMYDEALIVVLADHGVILRPDVVHRRVANAESVGEIAAVPLFIKTPHQTEGSVDDYRAETLDIVPTLVDALGIVMPWDTDGSSLLATDRPNRTESQITGSEGVVVFGVDGTEKLAISTTKEAAFGEGPFGLAPPGMHDLLGQTVDPDQLDEALDVTANIGNPNRYGIVDLSADSLPLYFNGQLAGVGGDVEESVVAVVFEDTIVAVTRTYDTEDETGLFYSILPPQALHDGVNNFAVLRVNGGSDARVLELIPRLG